MNRSSEPDARVKNIFCGTPPNTRQYALNVSNLLTARALLLRRGSFLVELGTLGGGLAALAVTRYLRSLLFETSPTDVPDSW